MMPPFRSKMAPRGAVSGIGRSRLVSARSWNFSCWRTWVRKNAPDQDEERGDQDQPRDVGALADAVGIEAVHASSLMANHSRNGGEHQERERAPSMSAWSGLYSVSSARKRPCRRPARQQQRRGRGARVPPRERRVDQQVVREEDRPAPGREVADHRVRQRAGAERAPG